MILSMEEWIVLWISLKTALAAVLCGLPAAILIGYLLARWNSNAKSIVEIVVNLPLVLPPVVTGYLLLLLLGRRSPVGIFLEQTVGLRISFTWLGAAIAAMVVSFPLMTRTIRIAFESVDPRLESAARSLGAGRFRTFFTISFPLAFRGVSAGCVLGFARSIGEFGATIMIAGNIAGVTQTIPLAIFSQVQRPDGVEQSWRLVCLSILIAGASLVASEILDRKARSRDST